MTKTIILAIFTLFLAFAALVTELVRTYSGSLSSAASVTAPLRTQAPKAAPAPVQVREPIRDQVRMQASNFRIFDTI